MRFEWDPKKDEANRRKHGVGFAEASQLFDSGVDYLEVFDEAHSEEEERFLAIGPISRGVVLVIWTERIDDSVRIISARWATRRECELYRQYMEERS
jgi:uncharacterized DUF497 family protein